MQQTNHLPNKADLYRFLQTLLSRAAQAPHHGSLPLFIAGRRCGTLFPGAVSAIANVPGVELATNRADFGRHHPTGETLNNLLAEIAQALRQAGKTPGWRGELLDVVPDAPDSAPIGAIERGTMRPLGLITQAVHLSGWSQDGKLWVARRSMTKATDPGMWDTLVGGLVSAGEPTDLALERESDEEAGLDLADIQNRSPLRKIARMQRQIPEGYQYEEVLTCECVLTGGTIPKNRDGEVMEIDCFAPPRVYEMLVAGNFTLEASIVLTEDLWRRAPEN
jgi:8-oxo-dGTP pyrophosphatase MutT (NUDIX family)